MNGAAKEFPDYPAGDLPPMPEGWHDSSWHNDACPSYACGNLHVYIDYLNPELSEWPESRAEGSLKRFQLIRFDDDGVETLAESDEWAPMLEAMKAAANAV